MLFVESLVTLQLKCSNQLLGNGLTAGGGQQRLRGSEGDLWHCFTVCPESSLAADALLDFGSTGRVFGLSVLHLL